MMTPVSRKVPEMSSSWRVWEHVSTELNIHEHTGVTIMEIMQRSDTTDVAVIQSERLLQNCEGDELFSQTNVLWRRSQSWL